MSFATLRSPPLCKLCLRPAKPRSQHLRSPTRPAHVSYLRKLPRLACAAESTSEITDVQEDIPPGCSRYEVSLLKPLGIVLETNASEKIYVAEIAEGSRAEEQGMISVGDQLIATSGVAYTMEQKYGETSVKGGEKIIQMSVQGESFDSVLAAIGSHPGHMPVTLLFQRC